ncbi:O-antigen ligase family protein [Candidatus Bathyarchaeota archaeon]|nr:O-antigen ligase family protein [Candidatus Bathyarchaeota archaeon]
MSVIALIGILFGSMFVGATTAIVPLWTATFCVGIPALILAILPQTRYWALLTIFALAPFMPFMKAFTGIRYGPVVLDIGLLIIVLGLFADQLVISKKVRLSLLDIGVLIFMLLGVVQLFNPLGPGFSNALEGYRILLWQAVGYLLGRRLLHDTKQIRTLLLVLRIVAVIVAIYAIKQFFRPSQFDYSIIFSTSGSPSTYTSLGQGRAFSTMSSPAHLSHFMVSMLLLNVSLQEFSQRRFWLILQLGTIGLALLLTIVRTGWIGFLVGLVLIGVLKALEKRNVTLAIKQLAIGIVIFLIVGYSLGLYFPRNAITQRFDSLANLPAEKHYQMRVDSWIETIIPAIVRNPWGYGTGSDNTSGAARFFSHNGYFYVAVELGIPGLILIFSVLIGALFKSVRFHSNISNPLLRSISRWTISFWGAALVMAVFGAFLEVYPVILYGWFFLGLIDTFPKKDKWCST